MTNARRLTPLIVAAGLCFGTGLACAAVAASAPRAGAPSLARKPSTLLDLEQKQAISGDEFVRLGALRAMRMLDRNSDGGINKVQAAAAETSPDLPPEVSHEISVAGTDSRRDG